MKSNYLLAGLAALALLGCSAMPGARPAQTETLAQASAVVQSVDQESREVVLQGDDGTVLTVTAGPEVRNLAQLAAGDRVTLSYYESVVLSMADPATAGTAGTVAAAARAPEGATPGAAAVVASDVVVTVLSYDESSGFATFQTPDGVVHRATVPPELRSFAAARRPGSQVNVSITQAVAVTITEG